MPSHRFTRPLAAGVAALALAAPAAQAHPAQDHAVLPSAHHTIAPQVRSTDTGFDVTSAAVGAAGLGLVALLAVGGSSLTGRRRMRPTA
jgi:hypothetical protein